MPHEHVEPRYVPHLQKGEKTKSTLEYPIHALDFGSCIMMSFGSGWNVCR